MVSRGKKDNFEEYITRLLAISSPEPQGDSLRPSSDGEDDDGTIRSNGLTNGRERPSAVMTPSATLGELDDALSGGMSGCRENVEILTRVSRKSKWTSLHVCQHP